MPRLKAISILASLMMCANCSNKAEPVSAPLPVPYEGIPAAMLEQCVVHDVPLSTNRSLVESRGRYIEAFNICAARVDAIRQYDAEARDTGE